MTTAMSSAPTIVIQWNGLMADTMCSNAMKMIGPDNRAVERADAAEHEHDERVRREFEADAVEPDHLRGDRRERAAHPGDEA